MSNLIFIKLYSTNHECDLNDSDVIEGLAKEWIEHEQFMPSLEMCAGKVHTPHLQELTILKMPEKFDIVDDDRVAAHYCNVICIWCNVVGQGVSNTTDQPLHAPKAAGWEGCMFWGLGRTIMALGNSESANSFFCPEAFQTGS